MSFECCRDAWGVPHLRAPDPLSLAYAQGWNAVADRAWQLENARRRAHGTASALIGERWLHWDRLARQTRLISAAQAAFDALDEGTSAWVRAYVDGVNAALADDLEPWEPWTPLAIWHSEHLLFGGGFPAKLWRERVRDALGEHTVDQFALDGPEPEGSNGWLIEGDHTASGAPIIAGDPHRLIQKPGFYQQVRLSCPEFDVIGFAVPGIPGIAHFGHAGDVAWGITNAMADAQDLFREQLRRKADGSIEALGPDGWEAAQHHLETIEVAGGDTHEVEVIETARGHIIAEGPEFALSLRGPVQELPDLGFSAIPKLLRARTVADVDAAFDDWVLPVNVVMAADTAGGTLHRVAGRVPDRDETNRRYPVPAWESRHTWTGWQAMPKADVDGLAVMANDRGISAPLGVEFCPPRRLDRIRTLLETRNDWAAGDMGAIHMDTLLSTAGLLIDLLPGLDLGRDASLLRKRLLAWDRRMDAGSADATAFAAFRAAFLRRLAALPVFGELAEPSTHPEVFAPWLTLLPRLGHALESLLESGLVPDEERDAALTAALEEAATEHTAWGDVHLLDPWIDLPYGTPWPDALAGPGGDADCVLSTSVGPGVTERFTRGPTARWVWDLADREQSRWIVPFGASGEPGPHQTDQFPLWRSGELIPLVTDWNALKEEFRLITRPAAYEQTLEGFGRVSVVPVRPKEDLDLIYGWVTEERAKFWGMTEHSKEYVLAIYEYLDALDTHHSYLLLLDGEPIALFQTYDPAADAVGECYEVEPGDVGTHLLVAGARDKARAGFTGALMGVLAGFLFTDPQTQRIVVEPDARNEQARARLRRTGFTLGPEIDLPDKRARLAFLRRADAPCLTE